MTELECPGLYEPGVCDGDCRVCREQAALGSPSDLDQPA